MRHTALQMFDEGHIPLDVHDANGMVIRRKITEFDTETGEVVSVVCDTTGRKQIDREKHEVVTRTEFYPAPLTWKSVGLAEVERGLRELWDLQGK